MYQSSHYRLVLTLSATDGERVGDVAGQTNMQRAAEAFVMRLGCRVGQYTVGMVKFPTQWYHAAFHSITGLLTYKAYVDTWKEANRNKVFLDTNVLGSLTDQCWGTHQCCIHDRGISPWEPLTGRYTVGEMLHNSGLHRPAGLLSSHTPVQTYTQIHS